MMKERENIKQRTRCMLYAMKTWERIAYSIKLEAFDPHHPSIHQNRGSENIAVQKRCHWRKPVRLAVKLTGKKMAAIDW